MQWTKAQKDRAKAEGKALWTYGYKGKAGVMEAAGVMDDQLAANLFGFVTMVYRGVPPSEAFITAGLDSYDPVVAPTEPHADA